MKYIAMMVVATLAACATGSPIGDTGTVPAGKSRIVVYRSGIMGAAIQPVIMVDGTASGRCVAKGAFVVDVAPGDRVVSATTEASTTTLVSAKAGQVSYVRCSVGFGAVIGRPSLEVVPASVGATESGTLPMTGRY